MDQQFPILTDPYVVDGILVIAAIVLPILCVWRWRYYGIIVGAFVNWVIIGMAGPILSGLDPKRDGPILDSLWVLIGWIFSLGYAVIVFLIIEIFRFVWRRIKERRSQSLASTMTDS